MRDLLITREFWFVIMVLTVPFFSWKIGRKLILPVPLPKGIAATFDIGTVFKVHYDMDLENSVVFYNNIKLIRGQEYEAVGDYAIKFLFETFSNDNIILHDRYGRKKTIFKGL